MNDDARSRRDRAAHRVGAVAVWIALTAPPAAGAAAGGRAGGYAETRAAWSVGVDGDPVQVVGRARPRFTADVGERTRVSAEIEVGVAVGRDLAEEVEDALDGACTAADHANDTLRVDRASDYLDVDRLYVDVYLPQGDLRVGRQSVQWGSAQLLNPTDPFPEFLFAQPWRPRRGVSALRADVPFGELNEVTAVVASDDAFQEVRAAGRVMFNVAETDLALVGAWRGDTEDGLAGLDLRGTLGVGWWIEGAVRLNDVPDTQLVVGLDYSFPVMEALVVSAQLFRNGAGATDPDDYSRSGPGALTSGQGAEGLTCDLPGGPAPAGDSPDPFAPALAARHYALASVALRATPDVSLSLAQLQNLDDGTAAVFASIAVTLTDWLDLSAAANVPLRAWSDGGELSPRESDLHPAGDAGPDLSGLVPDATLTVWTRASF